MKDQIEEYKQYVNLLTHQIYTLFSIRKEFIDQIERCEKKGKIMHKKIMEKAAKTLKKDALHYAKKIKTTKSPAKKKQEKVEMKEAVSAAKDLKKRAKMSHEY